MKFFKKLFVGFLAIFAGFLFSRNVFAGDYKVNLFSYKHTNEYGVDTLKDNDGVRFDLLSPKGNIIFGINCVEHSSVPEKMNKGLLGDVCSCLLEKCKKYEDKLMKIEITREKYFELMKICQGVRSKRKSLIEREQAMRTLILEIISIYKI